MLFCPKCARNVPHAKTWDGFFWNYTCAFDGKILIRCPDYLEVAADKLIAQ